MLDVFSDDLFGVVSLTTAINKLPFKPNRLGQLGIFKKGGITTTSVVVEEKHGRLALIPNVGRGADTTVMGGTPRQARSFLCTHLPQASMVYADDVQNMRAFGSETTTETVAKLVNDKLTVLRQNTEATHEYHRVGAIHGILLDADGTTPIYNWFTEFGIVENTLALDWDNANGVKLAAATIIRAVEDALGVTPYDHIHVMCGDQFFDGLTVKTETKDAYNRWREGEFLRSAQVRKDFAYAGVIWENYRGKVGDVDFFDDNQGRGFPVGAADIFSEHYAPANYVETVNTMGKAVYAKQERLKFDIGIELQAQSNPMIMCNRPGVLVEITETGTNPAA